MSFWEVSATPPEHPSHGKDRAASTHNGARETSLSGEASQAGGTVLPREAGGTRVPLQRQ